MNANGKITLKQYGKVFGLGALTSLLFFLPFLIWDKGLFIYYGDFNVQQIPFYQMCHDSILSGNVLWNWYTDLGANFIGSYSFYLLGSPFFWLTMLFPSKAVPYLMAPLLILKFATASVTGYAYIRRFVKNGNYAVIGALLYAFSGYSVYNIFFNHFHEVIAVFPLLLIAMEEFMVNGRRGAFALAVGLCAVVNYYFFFGEVIFAVIYFIFRAVYDRKNRQGFYLTWGKFGLLALEAVMGLLLSAVLLIPSLLAIADNPRTSHLLFGWNGIFYGNEQRYGLILSSFFFPPDIPAYPNFFPDSNAKWSSVSAFLPLFSMSGVLAFFKGCKRHWAKGLFGACVVIAFVPFLNSSFSAFNRSYYARWFYMFLLVMAMMTAVALERYREEFRFGVKWALIITLAFSVLAVFPSYEEDKLVFGKLIEYQERFWPYMLIAVIGLVLTAFLVQVRGKAFFRAAEVSVCFITVVMSILMIVLGKVNPANAYRVSEMALHGAENFTFLKDDPEEFYRIDLDDCMDNFPMFWKIPTIKAFHSVVPGSIFEFYDTIGYDRSVGSRAELKYEGLRLLTSVKYLLVYESREEDPDIGGFTYVATENGLKIYENENFIPMGFTYDYYVDQEALDAYNKSKRDVLMAAAIYLDDEAVARNRDILAPLPEDHMPSLSDAGLAKLAQERRQHTCKAFTRDNTGFTAEIDLDRENLVFFSVPYDKGFSAQVNGEDAVIEKANAGFMAVRVPAGSSTIRFTYQTPGLHLGMLATLGAAGGIACYILIFWLIRKRFPRYRVKRYAHLNAEPARDTIPAAEAYVQNVAGKVRVALKAAEMKEAVARQEKGPPKLIGPSQLKPADSRQPEQVDAKEKKEGTE